MMILIRFCLKAIFSVVNSRDYIKKNLFENAENSFEENPKRISH